MPVLPSYRNQSTDLQNKSLTGFYMRATLVFNELKPREKMFKIQILTQTDSHSREKM